MKKNGTLFLTWLLSSVSILLIPAVATGVAYVVASDAIEAHSDRTSSILISRIGHEIDDRLEAMKQLGGRVAAHEKIRALLGIRANQGPPDPVLVSEAAAVLADVRAGMSFGIELYLYLPSSGGGISPLAFLSEQTLYEHFHGEGSPSRSEWLTLLSDPDAASFVPVTLRGAGENEGRTIAHILPLTLPSGTESVREMYGTVVILLDERELLVSLHDLTLGPESVIAVTDGQSVLLSSAPTTTSPELISTGTGSEDERKRLILAGRPYVGRYRTSGLTGWRYLLLTPERAYSVRPGFLPLYTVASLISCLLAGGFFALIMTRRHREPLRELTENLMSGLGLSAQRRIMNEYAFVRDAISSSRDRQLEGRSRLEEQERQIRTILIQRMLKGKLQDFDLIASELSRLGLPSHEASCGVVLFSLDGTDELFPSDDETHPDDRARIAGYIAFKVVRETAARLIPSVVVESDPGIALLAFSHPGSLTQAALIDAGAKIRSALETGFQIRGTVSVSAVHESVAGIPEAYAEALYALESRHIWGEHNILLFEDYSSHRQRYSYPIETELRFIDRIKMGDLAESKKILEGIIDRNPVTGSQSVAMARCLSCDLTGTFIKTLNDFTGDEESYFIENLDPVERLSSCTTQGEMKEVLLDLLSATIGRINGRRTDHAKRLTERVQTYVQEHLSDRNLNVAGIAESFDLSPDYLSGFFREQTGTFLHEYVNRVRIEKVKELLLDGGMKIKDIAYAAGFHSSGMLIRTFRKHEGITPVRYRENVQSF